ncbi:MAG: YdcF family protein [Clostridia bacterium]|nr:YdcF family protein [Clostridia bacterium]
MKFDVRDKKPKLYHVLVEALLLPVILIPLLRSGSRRGMIAAGVVMSVFFAALVVQLFVAFVMQIHYNPYSYNTIFYFGFALFFIFVFLLEIFLTFDIIRYPGVVPQAHLFSTVVSSARNFMSLSAPFVLLFSTALCISNIALLRHEGKRLVNVLGILLSMAMVGGEVFLMTYDYYAFGSVLEVMRHDIIVNLFAAIYLYVECILVGVIVASLIVVRHEPAPDRDYMIILGCALRKDGTPSPLLRGRIDRALAFYRKQKAETGKELVFVTSGGQGADEAVSESASMKAYLMEQGIPESQIIEEDQSVNTLENMRNSKEIITARDPAAKIAFSTSNYHVFRSGLFARRVKLRAVGIGAKTKWYFWPNAAVREFIGLLTKHKGKQALILGSMVAFYVLATIVSYRFV